MEMTGDIAMWVWVGVIVVCIGIYYLYKQGKIPWLKGVRMPKMFEPKVETRIERLKAQTEKERGRAEELKGMLEAKRELAKARAENIRLMREIEGVSAKSVEKDKRDEERAEEKVREAEKVKPRRL